MTMIEKYRGMSMLPPGSRKGNRHWIIRGKLGWQREMTSGETDLAAARLFVDRLIDLGETDEIEHLVQRGRYAFKEGVLPKWAIEAMEGARGRAQRIGVKFDLCRDDMLVIVDRARGRCEVTGIHFSEERQPGWRRAPYAPSLDRIVPQDGYVANNCRLVAFAVNVAMSDWGIEVLRNIADAICRGKNRGKRRPEIKNININAL